MSTSEKTTLEVGDRIQYKGGLTKGVLTVDRVTKTMAICKHTRFKRSLLPWGVELIGADKWSTLQFTLLPPLDK